MSISGRILDENNEQGIPFATIVLKRDSSSEIINGTITDEEGYFVLRIDQRGDFIFESSYLGYQTYSTSILIGEKNDTYDLGKIELKQETTQLEEVTVTAQQAITDGSLSKNLLTSMSRSPNPVAPLLMPWKPYRVLR